MSSFYATPLHDRFTPVPVRPRADGWTVARQRGFVRALGEGLTIARAAQVVGMSARSAYRLHDRAGAGSFRKAWRMALELARPVPEGANPFRRMRVHRWRGRVVHREERWNDARVLRRLRRADPYRFDPERRAADRTELDRLAERAELARDFLQARCAPVLPVGALRDLSERAAWPGLRAVGRPTTTGHPEPRAPRHDAPDPPHHARAPPAGHRPAAGSGRRS